MARRTWRKKDVLRDSLLGLARNLGPGRRLPTVATLCESFSVSNATLDPILRDLENRGAIVREHGRGMFVASSIHCKNVGVVFGGDIFSPNFSPFWSMLLGAVRGQAGDRNILPRAYFDMADGHGQLVEDIKASRLDGLMLISPHYAYDEAAMLRAYGLPLVVFGGNPESGWSVSLDWNPFLEMAANELAQTGCRHVGFIGSPVQRPVLEAALDQVGLGDVRIDDWSYETWAKITPSAGSHENCAHRLAEQMLADRVANPLPDTIVSLEDTATRGVITALHQAGLCLGGDLRIITAENKGSSVLEPWDRNLTRIEFDPAECMAAVLDMLTTLMDNGTPPKKHVLIAPHAEQGLKTGELAGIA